MIEAIKIVKIIVNDFVSGISCIIYVTKIIYIYFFIIFLFIIIQDIIKT